MTPLLSNMPSLIDLYQIGYDTAQNTHSRMSYLYASCSLNDKFGLTKNVPLKMDVTDLHWFN